MDGRDLIQAVESGDDERVQHLLANYYSEYSQDAYWRDALFIAARRGHDRVLLLLLDHGCDPNPRDDDGRTPLLIAAEAGHGDVVNLLLWHGDVSACDKTGKNVLHYTAQSGQTSE